MDIYKIATASQITSNISALILLIIGIVGVNKNLYIEIQYLNAAIALAGVAHLGLIDGYFQRAITSTKIIKIDHKKRFIIIILISLLLGCAQMLLTTQKYELTKYILIISCIIINLQAYINSVNNASGDNGLYFISLLIEKSLWICLLGAIIFVNEKQSRLLIIIIPIIQVCSLLYAFKLINLKKSFKKEKYVNFYCDLKVGASLVIQSIAFSGMIPLTILISSNLSLNIETQRSLILTLTMSNLVLGYVANYSIVILSRARFDKEGVFDKAEKISKKIFIVCSLFGIVALSMWLMKVNFFSLSNNVFVGIAILMYPAFLTAKNILKDIPEVRLKRKINALVYINSSIALSYGMLIYIFWSYIILNPIVVIALIYAITINMRYFALKYYANKND